MCRLAVCSCIGAITVPLTSPDAATNCATELGNIALSNDELKFLQTTCPYLTEAYLDFLKDFRLNPREQVHAIFTPDTDTGSDADVGAIELRVKGRWVETILYEIPLLALTSEAYFRFMDTDWDYEGQEEKAYDKGIKLLEAGCIVSEFGTRRRRDYHTQALVFRGLVSAKKEGEKRGLRGKIAGTSNVHLAMRFKIAPIGTVAHEWFMGVAAITGDYENATSTALGYWVGCFGEGVLGIALTDTFGTPTFLKAFAEPVLLEGATKPEYRPGNILGVGKNPKTFAEVFQGVRQDSGDPAEFVNLMRDFYLSQHISPSSKTIVFSDSLDIDLCLKYKAISEAAGFNCTFGVGTFFTNDFVKKTTGEKSTPLNIVIKLSSADGNYAVKISDNIGKNTGDKETVERVKRQLGYVEKAWEGGDEKTRWGKDSQSQSQSK